MRYLKIFAVLVALNTGSWIIPQETFAQQDSASYRLFSPHDMWLSSNGLAPARVTGRCYSIANDSDISTTGQTEVVLPPVEYKYTGDENTKVYNNEQVYAIKPAVDIPIIAAGTIWSVYALSKIYNKTAPTVQEILSLNKNDVNVFDRWAIYPYNKNLDKVSYYPFYASIPLPFIFFLTNGKTSQDFFKLSLLYWETLSIMGVLGTSATYFVDRYRPYTYTNETQMDVRTDKVAKNSFFSGHVEMVAAPTFFIAKVYSDYFPESKIKWVFYGFASTVTVAVSYMRLKAGEHFPSDILLGAAVGALTGILVPEFHKIENSSVSFLPYSNELAKGITLFYQF